MKPLVTLRDLIHGLAQRGDRPALIAFSNPLARVVSRLAQIMPIDDARAATSSLAFGAAVLKQGRNLVWYPEGQRSPTGKLQPFKPGIGLLLHALHVPVVPVLLRGTYEALPPGGSVPHLEPITVRFGAPLDPHRLEQEAEGREPHDRIARALHDHLADLEQKEQGPVGHLR